MFSTVENEIKHHFNRIVKFRGRLWKENFLAGRECLIHYGAKCQVCNFSFQDYYEDIGTGFIHVHHLFPLSEYSGGI